MTGVDPNGILTVLLTLALCSTNVGWGTRGTPTAEIRCMHEHPSEKRDVAFIQASGSTVLHCVGRGTVEETNLRRAICSRPIGFCPTIWSLIGTLGLIDLCWDFSGSVGE